jgi:hypothetical protein
MTRLFALGTLTAAIAISPAMEAKAEASTRYLVTFTNGATMPLSPGVIYVGERVANGATLGRAPSSGFIQLCQTGNPAGRLAELKADSSVRGVQQTSGPILPGDSLYVEVEVQDPRRQAIHFETMYGKSKDLCAVGSANSHGLYALQLHATQELVGKDDVLQTGAFLDPVRPGDSEYPDPDACGGAMNAVSCLREVALPNPNPAKVRFFSAYSPSLLTYLETRFGAEDVSTLQLPSSGALRFQVRLKH